jgi:AcrR family transcriptional regulator
VARCRRQCISVSANLTLGLNSSRWLWPRSAKRNPLSNGPMNYGLSSIGSMPATARRPRRSSSEVRGAILTAAEDLFGVRGFAGTTTREIAKQAGVAEALVYTNFGNKTRLFEAAVVDRYETFLAEHVELWSAGITNPETMSRFDFVHGFVDSFMTYFSDNRNLCLTYLEYHRLGNGQSDPPNANFAAPLRTLEKVLVEHGTQFGLRELDVTLTVRAVIAMVLGLVLHDHVLFTGMCRPGRERLVREVSTLILTGIESPTG